MPNKTINARVKQKRDTHTNWQSKNPVILNGEIILVDIDGGLRAKVGNGTKKYSELPFSDEALRSLIDAKVPTSRTINGKALTGNISLSASDIGADASGSASTALTNANKYTDEEISTLSQDVAGSIGSLQTELTAAINSKQPAGDYATKAEAQGYADAKDSAITAAKSAGTTAQTNLNNHTKDKSNPHGVTASQVGAVPTTRTINNKALSTNISLTASDVGADVSGSAGSALESAKSYTDSQIDEWVGDTKVSVQISEAIKNHSDSDHNHKYAGSDSFGGAATSANKVNKSLIINGSGLGADAGVTFDGSNEITISYNTIGAAASSHGNHVPETETANNAKFLRNDNSWAIVTPENIGAAKSNHGTHVAFSEVAPKAAGTAAVGTAATVSRSDHVHPAQTSITGNAATATKATQDASGNVITSTYATKAELKEVGDLVGDTAVSTQISTAVGKITHPVTSVNSKTGAVSLTYSDVDAAPSSHAHTMLSNKYTSRPTTANIASSEDRKGSLEFFTATSSMTTGKPPYDAHILHMNWDNTEGWDAQLAVRGSSTAGLAVRGMNGGTWGDWTEVAMKNHAHTNVNIVTLGGDVLALALSSCTTGGLTPVITNSASTNLPSGSYGYSAGYVIKRVSDQATIVLFDYNTGDMATNTYINGAWKGWVKEATQDYVRDAISNIGSSTASGCVSEFDSGVISYAPGSTYYNTKDSKSKFYLVTAKHSSYGSHSWVIDFNYLTTSNQYFRVQVGASGSSPVWITIQVKKDSSNRLVVGIAPDCTNVTMTQVCGYY